MAEKRAGQVGGVREGGVQPFLRFRVEGKMVAYVRMTQRNKFYASAQRYLNYRSELSARAKEALAGEEPFGGPVAVHILIAARKRRFDIDNATKCILDGLNGVAFVDDKQVVKLGVDVRDGEFEYVHVTVEGL